MRKEFVPRGMRAAQRKLYSLQGFRTKHRSIHSFRRQGDNILIFSADGTPQNIALRDNFGAFFSQVKDGLIRHLAGLGRNPYGLNPIELVSTKPEDNLLIPILGDAYAGSLTSDRM